MESLLIPLGSLVQHAFRPGVWRVIGYDRQGAGRPAIVIEPWDDQSAGAFHAAEAYSLTVPAELVRRLQPGRGTSAGAVTAASA